MDWSQFGYVILALLFLGLLIFFVRRQRDAFTKENFIKSFGTMGWLTLLMIAVIAFCIYLLK